MPHDRAWKSGMGNYVAVVLSLTLFSTVVEAQSGAWTKKADMPYAKVGASACVVDGKIYVFGAGGCYAACHTDLAASGRYDPLTDTWETGSPVPTPRGFFSTAAVQDTIYTMGGGYPTLADLKTTVEAYDPATNKWQTKRDMLSPRFCAQAAVVDGIIYNAGGNYDQRNCEAYDPVTNTWTRKRDRPESGGAFSVTAWNGLIYTFGGSTYSLQALSTVCAYDPRTDTWTMKAAMPTARFGLQTYLVDGKIYAIGGSTANSAGLAVVEVYDPVSNSWKSRSNMPDKLAWFGGAVVNNKIYLFGGTSDGVSAKKTVWEYDPAFHTNIPAGDVSGTWAFANSPYRVLGEITIPNDSTLTIEPGVEVVFMGHHKLNVQGRFLAVGTKKDTIRFTAQDTVAGWHGIRFMNTPNTNDTSRMVYCSFKYGKANTGSGLERCGGAVLIHAFDKVLISDCLFDSNLQSGEGWDPPYYEAGPAIYSIYCSPVITKNTFSNNVGSKSGAVTCLNSPGAVISRNTFIHNRGYFGPIVCDFGDTPTISDNIISRNVASYGPGGILIYSSVRPTVSGNIISYNVGGGIAVVYNSSPWITNNIIVGNFNTGVTCWDSSDAVLINNTIAFNHSPARGGGLLCDANADPILINTILYGNTAPVGSQVCLADPASDPHFRYCDIQGGVGAFGGNGSGANYGGTYEDNIDADPGFVDTANADYRLSGTSLCIGAGSGAAKVGETYYHPPPFCIMGNERPSPIGTAPDIGACESLLGTPTGLREQPNAVPTGFVLEQNYPNPFNPNTIITYQLPRSSEVRLSVYDMLGREVSVLVHERKDAGVHEVVFDGVGLSSGMYLYRFSAGDWKQTRRFVLLK